MQFQLTPYTESVNYKRKVNISKYLGKPAGSENL